MSSFFLETVHRWFFPQMNTNPEILSRAWLMFWTCMLSGGLLLGIIFVSSILGFQGEPFTLTILGHTCVILCVFSLRFSTTMRFPSLLIGLVSTLQLMQASYWSGGFESPVVYAYPILPVFLVYIGGIRVATLSGCMLVGTLVSFTHYKTSAIELSPFIELMVIIWALFTGIFIAGFAHYRETLSRNTILSQVQKQKEMQAKIQGIVKENSLFWSNISHELRNNITILFSFSELLDLEKPQGKQKRYLEHMLHTCTHVQSLLDQTMLLAQVNSGTLILQKKYFSLNALLLSLQQKFFVQAKEKKINFILDINIKHDSIYADEHRFHQVLTNLLSNAIKFTHSGSVSLSVQEQEDEVIFSVIDTGIGIPTEDQDSIFEPYHRINKRATNGMGLGLSIVKNILESMNTELIICSSPQEGTKCTFSFMIHVD